MTYSLQLIRHPSFMFAASDRNKSNRNENASASRGLQNIHGVKIQYQCLEESNLRDLISTTDQVILTMPAKSAGTTLKDFAEKCNKDAGLTANYIDNMLNFRDENHFDGILSKTFQMPPVLSSHMYKLENFLYLIKNVPPSTLLIYIHREETTRVQSAVNEVITNWCRKGNGHPDIVLEPPTKDFFLKENESVCHISEKNLIDIGLGEKGRELEIGLGASKLLRCETYNTILEYAPNMIFMNYKNANDLQNLISENYCPGLALEPIESNVGSEKETQTFVQVANGARGKPELVALKDWLKAKQSSLEWALGLNDEATCTANTRIMENKLFGCEEGFLRASVVES